TETGELVEKAAPAPTLEYKTKTMEKTRITDAPAEVLAVEETPAAVAEPVATEEVVEEVKPKTTRGRKPKTASKSDILDLSTEDLDKKIEAALSEDLLK
ncbi:MAG TPA: hypothetical protein VEA59_03365, partial [Patescibacteria group bacterium]|nr:hypothetical protein [Patescibacteria group bacterium]